MAGQAVFTTAPVQEPDASLQGSRTQTILWVPTTSTSPASSGTEPFDLTPGPSQEPKLTGGTVNSCLCPPTVPLRLPAQVAPGQRPGRSKHRLEGWDVHR